MIDFLKSLSNREVSVAIWTCILILWALSVKDVRNSLRDVAVAFFNVKICLPFLSYASYCIGAVWLLSRLHLWEWSELKDTLIWFGGTAVVSFFGITRASRDPGFFTGIVLDALKLTVIVEFIISTYVGPIQVELILVPVITLLSCCLIVARTRDEYKIVVRLIETLLNVVGICVVTYAMWAAYQRRAELVTHETMLQIAVAPLLTLMALPFLYLLALWMEYEGQFIRLGFWLEKDRQLLKHAKLAILKVCGFRLGRLTRLKGQFYLDLQEANGIEGVRAAVMRHGLEEAERPEK